MSTITYVGIGTVATANNAGVTPGLPASLAAGDALIAVVSIRNLAGLPNPPTDWVKLLDFDNLVVFARAYAPGVTAPTITFTGGVANADTQAAILAFRNVSPESLDAPATTSTQNNSSTANIGYPAFNPTGPGNLALLAVWKQDDVTTVTTPAGLTRPLLSSTTTGDDATLAAYYQIQTTTTTIGSGTLTVTGGAAAVSYAVWLALKPAPSVAVTEQDSWPPRVQIAVTDLTVGDNVEVYRVVGGVWTPVRAGAVNGISDPSFIAIDSELPFGIPVSYAVYVNGYQYLTASDTYALVGGQVALTDAITGGVAEVIIGAAGDKTYDRDSARFRVAGKNLVVSGPMGQAEGSYELLAMTTTGRDGIMWLLEHATQGIVQIRQAGQTGATGETYDGIDAYLAVDRVTERRWSQDGSDPRRLITIEYAEVDGWAAGLQARGFTLGDVADYFGVTGTLQDIADFFGPGGTLLDIALADWTP